MTSKCHKCGRITCVCWAYEHKQKVRSLVGSGFDYQFRVLVILGCLVSAMLGCATKNTRRIIPPPPLPSNQSFSVDKSTRPTVQSAFVAPRVRIRLDWDKVETNTACMTEVWSSPNPTMEPRTLKTNVLGSYVIFDQTLTQEFFIIRNNLNGEVSAWNTK